MQIKRQEAYWMGTIVTKQFNSMGKRIMTELTPPQITIVAPRIGSFWAKQGGIYAGIVAGKNDEPDYHLIHAPSDFELTDINWLDAITAAKNEINGFNDWSLPDRRETRLLYINSADSFDVEEWYWTREQNEHSASYAWMQDFRYGGQDYYRKSRECRARAVRRLSIIE